jgi:hypothetical protein
MTKHVRKVSEVVHHRNGVGGWPFYVIRFETDSGEPMVAVVFPQWRDFNPDLGIDRSVEDKVAVFSEAQMPEIRFGQNSWRGDTFAPELYDVIEEYQKGVRWS